MKSQRHLELVLLAALIAVTIALRAPLISAGMPYFYNEDEAHHFNRTVEMTKNADFNPHYFHKPSLHFYIRMPIVALTAKYMETRGTLASLQEIRTRDPYGLAGYAFTASHPLVVRSSRALSVLMSLLLVLFTYAIGRRLSCSPFASFCAALFVSVSPEVVLNSPIIGVDMLMAAMVAAAVLASLTVLTNPSTLKIAIASIIAGLAISSKYNAAPIAFVPILATYFTSRWRIKPLCIAAFGVVIGFFAGSPFILLSFKEFWSDLGYEVWHYRVAGHTGHSAEPGLDQLFFYLSWLASDGIGLIATAVAGVGIIALLKNFDQRLRIVFLFPLLFAILMIAQRANFTRNMVAIVPFAAILCGYVINYLQSKGRLVPVLLAAVCIIEPARDSLVLIQSEVGHVDSRNNLADWLKDPARRSSDIGIAGQLLMPISLFSLPGVDAFNLEKSSIPSLALQGYDYLIVPSWAKEESASLSVEKEFDGNTERQRIVDNPRISILKVNNDQLSQASDEKDISEVRLVADPDDKNLFLCPGTTKREPHCWVTSRITRVVLEGGSVGSTQELQFEVMTPWDKQTLTVKTSTGTIEASIAAGTWQTIDLKGAFENRASFTVYLSRVSSMASRGLSSDSRRLGMAIRSIKVNG